jgi:hypothetical protein
LKTAQHKIAHHSEANGAGALTDPDVALNELVTSTR